MIVGSGKLSGVQKQTFLRRHPVGVYFALTFAISWLAALAVAAPYLIRHEGLPKSTSILMFPLMLLGPSLSSIVLTSLAAGRRGVADLMVRMFRVRVALRWYAALLIPPALVLGVLLSLQAILSPVYAPNHFLLGVLFAIPAGFVEEIGWMGYAFPRMRVQGNGLRPAVLLGVLWALWHLPIVDHLGAAAPHGTYWLPFFMAFSFAMTAVRVLICWIYTNTSSVFLTQLMHVSSTGALVVLGAPRASPAEEALWYALYGGALWVGVAIVVWLAGRQLNHRRSGLPPTPPL